MCRLALYWGPPILISEFLLKPSRSIIKVRQGFLVSCELIHTRLARHGDCEGVHRVLRDVSLAAAVLDEK